MTLLKNLGEIKGLSDTLGNMATIYVGKNELDRALSLYQESLDLYEQLGDKQGKATLLSKMANIYMHRKDWEQAEKILLEAFELVKTIGEPPAFELVKLGQVAQARGDKETALSRYSEGLEVFERMGMPEAQQVREMIASLEGVAVSSDDPLAQVLAQARDASQRGDVQSAIQYQEQAVSLARGAGEGREALVTLSVILYNLAGFYQKTERHDDAVKAMEEVVAIDEQAGHQDLESDRERLETLRRIASLSPEEHEQLRQQAEEQESSQNDEDGFETQLQAQLAQLPSEKRAEAEAQIRKAYAEFQRMSPEEQARALQVANDQSNRAQIDIAANKARDAGLAYVRKQAPKKDIVDYLTEMSQKAAEGEKPGSPWLDVAALCNALVALIQEESIPPVPAAYAGHFSAVQSEVKRMKDE